MNYKNVCDKYGEEVGLKVLDFIEEGWGENGCDEFKLDGVSVLKEVVEEFVKEICYNNSMKEVIKEGMKMRGELLRCDYGYEIDECDDDCWFYILKGGEIKKESCYNNSMKEVINKEIEKLKNELEKDGVEWKEEDVRLCVFEDLRDCLKLVMSDVSY